MLHKKMFYSHKLLECKNQNADNQRNNTNKKSCFEFCYNQNFTRVFVFLWGFHFFNETIKFPHIEIEKICFDQLLELFAKAWKKL